MRISTSFKSSLFVGLALIALTGLSQTPSIKHSTPLKEASPAKAGMSAERLARIDTLLQDAVSRKEIPGAVALVARNGKIVYYKAFGTADVSTSRDLKRDDIFRIASQNESGDSYGGDDVMGRGEVQAR